MIGIRKNWARYELGILFVFLLFVVVTRKLDIALPVLFVLTVLPHARRSFRAGPATLMIILITTFYLVQGIIFNNAKAAITDYVSRICQFVLFLLILESTDIRLDGSNTRLIRAAVIAETLVDAALLLLGRSEDIRLISGNQPVGGNIAIAVLPLILYAFFTEPGNAGRIIRYWGILTAWVFLSGTRGYIVLWFMGSLPVLLDYVRSGKGITGHTYNYRMVFFLLFIVLTAAMVLLSDSLAQWIERTLRLTGSTGTRKGESRMAGVFFHETTDLYRIFGGGYGRYLRSIPGVERAYYATLSSWSAWGYAHYVDHYGSAFHNYYNNMLLLMGVLGLLMVLAVFVIGCRSVVQLKTEKSLKAALLMYWIGFFVMLYFRWSCSCGLAELPMLAVIISDLRKKESDRICLSDGIPVRG